MNIDLFVSKRGRVCLVSDQPFERAVELIQFDQSNYHITLVFEGSLQPKTHELNLPIDYSIVPYIVNSDFALMGVIVENKLVGATKVPLETTHKEQNG